MTENNDLAFITEIAAHICRLLNGVEATKKTAPDLFHALSLSESLLRELQRRTPAAE